MDGSAHQAAAWGSLPKDFNQCELTDKKGQTVRDIAEEKARRLRETKA